MNIYDTQTTEVVKKGRPVIFWIASTSIFWFFLFFLCGLITFFYISSFPEVQKFIATEFSKNVGVEVVEEKTEYEKELEKKVEELQNKIDKYELREIIESEITPKSTPTPTQVVIEE